MEVNVNVNTTLTAEEKNLLNTMLVKWARLNINKKEYIVGLTEGLAMAKERPAN